MPQAIEIRSGPEAPGRDGLQFGLLSVYWCCCSFVGCSAVRFPLLVALLGPKIVDLELLPKETKHSLKICIMFNVFVPLVWDCFLRLLFSFLLLVLSFP